MKHTPRLTGFLTMSFLLALLFNLPAVFAQSTNTLPIVTVTATDPTAVEGTDNVGVFTFSRSPDVNGAPQGLQVFYEVSGTAQNGIDYQSIASAVVGPTDPAQPRLIGSILFLPGVGSAQLKVVPLDDQTVEGTETVVVRVIPPILGTQPSPSYVPGLPSEAVVVIEDNDKPKTNKPPVVRLVMPDDGATFTAPGNVLLVAQARDDDGEVKTVEFFAGDQSLGVRTNLPVANPLGPFVLAWNNVAAGEYTLTAKATDDLGATTVSDPVKIVVTPESVVPVVNIEATDPKASEIPVVPPWLDIAQRIDPATFTIWRCGNTSADLEVHYRIGGTASNGVDYVEISNAVTIPAGAWFATVQIWPIDDGEVEGTETVVLTLEPKDCGTATSPVPGCYSVGSRKEATAYILDNDVKPNAPPIVKLLSPPDGAQFTAPAGMVLTALARDEDGWVAKVEFFAGDRSLGVVERPNLSVNDRFYLNWDAVAAGEYTLTAKATDNFGAATVSDSVHIVVGGSDVAPFVLIPKGAVWKYLDNGSDQGTAWREPGFDDQGWAAGPAQLGFGDGDEATVLNPGLPDHQVITYYFRDGFGPLVSGPTNLILHLLRDDGAVVYLNGTEVFRSNMPDGAINFQTLALSSVNHDAEHVYYSVTVDPSLLKDGGNVVAVEVHQVVASSADLSFDLELLANVPPPTNQPPMVKIVTPASGAVFLAPASIPIRAEAADQDGIVKKVEFYAGTQLLGSSETTPYSLTWSNVPVGEYVLTAKATDDDGATATSDGVKVSVIAYPPEQTVVNIEATDPEAAEINPLTALAPNNAVFTVGRSGGTNIALPVFYAVGGTAENGVDYVKLSGQVTIPEGAWSATIVIKVIDDSLVEGTESVVIELQPPICPAIYPPPPECYRVGEHGRAEAHILDNDGPPPNLPPMARISQPHQGEVFRAPADIQITAVALDPDGWVGLVEFFANDVKIGEERIVFIQAPPPGETQTFSLDWTNVPVGEYALVVNATDDRGATGRSEPVKIRVVDDTPPPPVIAVYTRDGFAREGTNSTGEINTATFVVRRNDGTNSDLTVFYSLHGTAENGVDYEMLPGSVTIPAGSRSARIVVTPIDDQVKERIETVVLKLEPDPSLSPISHYTIGWPGKAAAIIVDNDEPPPPCRRLPDGLFHLCQPRDNGSCVRVECSTDMVNWIPLCTSVVTEDAVHFVDPEANDYPNRFYRVSPEINIEMDE